MTHPKPCKRKMERLQILFLVLLALATTISTAQAGEAAADSNVTFGYIPGSWNGPDRWGYLKKEWATCKTGRMQSPINLAPKIPEPVPNSMAINKFYQPGRTTLTNKGHKIVVEWQDGRSRIQINGKDYILRNCHWHSPSEHTIQGWRYPLELHMVHQSADNEIAVIGLVYLLGSPDPFIAKLATKIATIYNTTNRRIDAGIIDPREIKMEGNMYFRYMGSLTTPPCTEGVIWTVNQQPATVSLTQVELLQNALREDAKANSRPLQSPHRRKVNLFVQKKRYGEALFKEVFAEVAEIYYSYISA